VKKLLPASTPAGAFAIRWVQLQEYVTACERLGRVPDAALLAAVLAAAQQQ
jgi:hypothetical protein